MAFFRNSRTLKKGLVVNNIMLFFVASQFVQLGTGQKVRGGGGVGWSISKCGG